MSILDRVMEKAKEAIGRTSGDLLANEVAKAIGELTAIAPGFDNRDDEESVREIAEKLAKALAKYEQQTE